MKTIGFIDYYVSEWHANHYPIWIRELASKTGREYTVKYAIEYNASGFREERKCLQNGTIVRIFDKEEPRDKGEYP